MVNADGRVDGNHSTVYTSANILAHPSVQLTRGGLILIGLLSGGDYHQAGLRRCGPGIAHGLAKCGLGNELLEATESLSRDELPEFLANWREDLRGELRTNVHGHLGSKKPSLAKAVPDSFPNIDVLLSYTNPITSATDAGTCHTHMPPRWEREPDLGKLAHLCELHFEWGLQDVIVKRFRTIVWPSIVLRMLRRSALESTAERKSCRERAQPLQDIFGTPSKPLACDTGGDGDSGGLQDLIVQIHNSRMHAYTDSIPEYRIEVAPAQLVHLASAGIRGLRKPVDTTYDVLPSESEDESSGGPDVGDTGTRRKKRGTGPPPEPDSHLRMWMPACMVRPALPELVERYEAKLETKRAKKSKGKQRAPPATKTKTKSTSKRNAVKLQLQPVDSDAEEVDLNVSCSSEDEEGGGGGFSPPLKTHMQATLPVASLCHSQLPESIHKHPTQEDHIFDITMSDDDDAPGLFERQNPHLSSPSKVLQMLDGNLPGAPLPPSAPSPLAHERPASTSDLRPFPMALEEEESSNGSGYPSYSLQTPFAAFCTPRALTPPPLPAKEAHKSGSDEGQVPCVETSIISISSSGSDDPDDGLALAPLLVAQSHTFVHQRVVATSEDVIDLT